MCDKEIEAFFLSRQKDEQNRKLEEYKRRNKFALKGEILFAGSSLMENFPIGELQMAYPIKKKIYNRGIGGYVLSQFEENLETLVYELQPSKLFLNIGSNDLNFPEFDIASWLRNYERVLDKIKKRLPALKIYVMAFYPGNKEVANPFFKNVLLSRTNQKIATLNKEIETLAKRKNIRFIDVNAPLEDKQGNLKASYSIDGVHFYGDGYAAILPYLLDYLNQ